MSFFSDIYHWAQTSGVLAAAQKEAAQEVSKAIQAAVFTAAQHAPGMQGQIEQAGVQMMTQVLAGLATQAK